MRFCKVMHGDKMIADKVGIAQAFPKRLLGLQWKASLKGGEGLLIRPCRQIHTFHMKFCIDVLFLENDGTVCHVIESMQKNCISPKLSGHTEVLELCNGVIKQNGIQKGDKLTLIMMKNTNNRRNKDGKHNNA